jgi:hypothetical protein
MAVYHSVVSQVVNALERQRSRFSSHMHSLNSEIYCILEVDSFQTTDPAYAQTINCFCHFFIAGDSTFWSKTSPSLGFR